MWLQFTNRTHFQIAFISYPKTSSKVRLMRMIKNKEIFLVQISTRPFPKHIYRSLRALLNSTRTRNEFGSFQTKIIHKIEGSKPCIDTFYTKTRKIPLFHTRIHSIHTKTLDFHTNIHSSIPMIFFLFSLFVTPQTRGVH